MSDLRNPHLVDGDFQSDKYPTTPRGKVPLSTKDPMAQDLLAEYARRRRAVDGDFAEALETALRNRGYEPARKARVIFVCDGCGDREEGEFNHRGDAFKPRLWFQRTDDDGTQLACCRACIDRIAASTGKTKVVSPI